VFSARNTPKRFWRDSRKWNSRTFQLANEFSREWSSQEFFTVKQRLDRKPLVHRCDKVTHAFDEEEPVLIAIAPVALKFPNSSKGGCDV
jgi:hypothetical protein